MSKRNAKVEKKVKKSVIIPEGSREQISRLYQQVLLAQQQFSAGVNLVGTALGIEPGSCGINLEKWEIYRVDLPAKRVPPEAQKPTMEEHNNIKKKQ